MKKRFVIIMIIVNLISGPLLSFDLLNVSKSILNIYDRKFVTGCTVCFVSCIILLFLYNKKSNNEKSTEIGTNLISFKQCQNCKAFNDIAAEICAKCNTNINRV